MSEALSGISPNDLPDIESDDEDEDDTSQNDGTQEGKSRIVGESPVNRLQARAATC